MAAGFIEDDLQSLKRASLYRRLRLIEGEQGPVVTVDGEKVLNFSSNNYLGLANHPALCAAAKEAIDRYGCGSGATRLNLGNMNPHEGLERKIADRTGTETAQDFNSGIQANPGNLTLLIADGDDTFTDALNYSSTID